MKKIIKRALGLTMALILAIPGCMFAEPIEIEGVTDIQLSDAPDIPGDGFDIPDLQLDLDLEGDFGDILLKDMEMPTSVLPGQGDEGGLPTEGEQQPVELELQVEEAQPVSVVFETTPEDTVITVRPAVAGEDPAQEALPPQVDGSYLLLPGQYTYSATAEGYVGIEGAAFEVLEAELPQYISVVLEPEEVQLEETQPEETQPEETQPEEAPESAPFEQSKTVSDVTVTVRAEAGAFPDGATLSVKRVSRDLRNQASEAIEDVRDEDQNVAASYTFDIKVLDGEGNELQPAPGYDVEVSFALAEVEDENLEANVYHVTEEGDGLTAEKLEAGAEADTVTAITDGFSLYTVEFTYNNLEYVLPGDTAVPMSEILAALNLTGEVTAAKVSDKNLFNATLDDGEWVVEALQPFTSTEWMKVTINGVVYKITVTDSLIQSVNYIDEEGKTQTRNAAVLTAEDTTWTANNETNGWYVVNDILQVNDRITVQGDVKLILANVTTLTASKGITVPTGSSLSVYAQSRVTGAGVLAAYSSSGAAIGEYDGSGFGTVNVYGGVIVASSNDGVGIGANNDTAEGSVSINGAVNIHTQGGNGHPGISKKPVELTVGKDVYVYKVYDREQPKDNVVIDKIDGDYAREGTMIFNNEEPDKVAELTSQTVYDHAPFYNRKNAVSQWMAKGGTLKLCSKNMELDDTVDQIVLTGHDDYALDLNGLGLIYKKDDAAPIITVGSGATLVLEDSNATKSNSVQAFDRIYGDSVSKSVKGGFITTSKDKNGGAYRYRAGGAVNVTSGGRFTMDCGTILGNEGSGVRLAEQNAVFTMSGGSIIGNKASVGSGVYMSAGTFKLCGAPVISDNYASNVYLFTQNKINISGVLAEGASVGVTMQESAAPVFTTNYGVKNADVPPDTYFTSDATGKKVLKVWDSNPVEAKLGEHLHEYTCEANEEGTAVTITCANRDCGHEGNTQYTLDFKIPDPYVYGAVSKPEDLLDAEALAAFNEAYKDTDTVTAEKIKFFKQGSDTMLNSMPIDVGDYKAQLTIKAMDNSGDITISQEYTIAPKDITITGISVMNKTYDGTTSADIAGTPALDGIAYGDALSIDSNNAKASFGDKAAATDKPVTIEGYTLVGDKAANYNLVQPTGIKATIDKRELLLTWNYDPAEPLVYNGKVQAPTVTARVAKADVASEKGKGLVGDDTCTLAVEGGHKDAGSYTATASSPSNPNYRLPTDATLTQDYTIVQKPVTIDWDEDTTLVYNGKAQAPEATATVLKGDSCEVTVSGAQTNAGDNYTATATGLSNMNYRLPMQTDEGYNTLTTTFSIVKKTLELSWGETFFKHDGDPHVPTVTATNLVEGDTCPLTASGAETEMGTYTATADEPSNTNYKLPDDKTIKFVIGKKKVPLTWENLSFTYDGQAHEPTVTVADTNDGETCVAVLKIVKIGDESGQACEAIDAGTYRATVTSLTNNYIPEDNSELVKDFGIVQKPVTLKWSNTSLTYDGTSQKPTATVANLVGSDTCEVTVSGEQKNASDTSYTATAVKLSNGNYKLPDATQDCQTSYTIARKVAELSWSNTTLTYNGQELKPTATVANKAAGDTCTVTVTGGQTNAGDYIATASGLSNDNYALPADATGSFTINKKTVGLNWGNAVYTYDGQNHLPEATATNLVSGDTCEVTVTGAQKNAGSHTATASELSNPNYALPAGKTYTFTIGKRTVGLAWSGETTFGYDGELHAPTATATDLVSDDTCEVTVTGAQKNAGTYTATASGLSNSNYALPSAKTQAFTIEQKVATLEWSNTAMTYSGGYQKPTASVTNLVPGDSCTVTVGGEQKDAGSYTATATRLSNSNYQLPAAATQGFTIGQKVIGLSWSKTSLTYDGQEQQPTVRATGLASGDSCTVTVSGGQKNAGSYTATASALSNANYALPEAVTQQYTINPKTIGLTWSDTSFIYDGQSHVPTATATDVIDGDTCTVTVDGAAKDVGRYTASASALSSTNYALPSTKTQSFSIKQRTVDLTWSNTSFTYDGQSHVPTAVATDLVTGDTCAVTVTGAATRAGSYTATASALSNANYALPSDKTQAFTIGKKTVGLTWTNTLLTYNGSSQKPTATATGLVGSDTCNVTVTGEQRNVGTGYTATASRLSNSNYALPAAVTQTFAIAPKTVGLTWSNTRLTYNGQPQQPTVRVTGLASGDTCTVTVIGAQTNAGSYTASASALSSTNYVLPATVTQEFTIAQKVVRLTWGTTSFTYDGQSHVPTATATDLISGDTCDVTVTGAATDVGTYTATASTLSNANYALPASTAKSFTIVASATPTVTPGPTETPEPTALPTDTIIIAPETITLNKTGTVKLNINKTLTLKAALTPTDAEDELVWTSSRQNVATVDKNGKVRPVARGTTKITATTFNGLSASVKVKVISIPAKKVSIVAKSKTITVGKKLQLKVKLTPTNSTDLITWKSSNTKIARVSKTGKVTGIKAGTVIITARTSSGKAAKIKLKVVSARK